MGEGGQVRNTYKQACTQPYTGGEGEGETEVRKGMLSLCKDPVQYQSCGGQMEKK